MEDVGLTPPECGLFNIAHVCAKNMNAFLDYSTSPTLRARCDMADDGGGWTVILRRNTDATPRVNFARSWEEYERGFGDLNTEFWYGLHNIHCLTTQQQVDLRIELKQSAGTQVWTYGEFVVDGPHNNSTLHIGQAVGVSEGAKSDTMSWHNGMQFSTHDVSSGENCAVVHGGNGGWWYKRCIHSVLTGIHTTSRGKIFWFT